MKGIKKFLAIAALALAASTASAPAVAGPMIPIPVAPGDLGGCVWGWYYIGFVNVYWCLNTN